MSVLIKGMKMPHRCSDCNFYNPDYCMQNNIGHRECALVELPKKHGRLIDADVLLLDFELAQKSADVDGREYANAFRSAGGELSTEWWAVEDIVKNAKTVIDAEGE